MQKIFQNINQVLAEWDPIGVGKDIAIGEYQGYIPLILKYIENRPGLIGCLEHILVNKIGLDYDPMNKAHVKDLERVCDKLIRAYKLNR